MKLWNRGHDFNLNTSIKSYLYKAAINTALNHIKTQKKSTNVETYEHGAMDLASVGTEEILSFKEVQEKLAKSLDKLPPKCKAIFILIKYEDMSYAEASKALGVSVKTIENQMGKALKHMRMEMQEYLGYLLSLFIIVLNRW
jgi:RNA polymerase sigma-70 factor (ECF subfamily)